MFLTEKNMETCYKVKGILEILTMYLNWQGEILLIVKVNDYSLISDMRCICNNTMYKAR
jgi:hypothetical protein